MSRYATIGEKSIIPSGGSTRAIGRTIQSVSAYDARANQQPQQYYDNNGYLVQSVPPGYAPRPYSQPRGFFE